MARSPTIKSIHRGIREAFDRHLQAQRPELNAIFKNLPEELKSGKLYEAHVLAKICENLSQQEGLDLVLSNGNHLYLKSSPSAINNAYPAINAYRNGIHIGEIWTDIEVTGISAEANNSTNSPGPSEYHELDIVMTFPSPNPRPSNKQIIFGAECKNTSFQKSTFRGVLGMRRELSLLCTPKSIFRMTKWPKAPQNSEPPVAYLVFSSEPSILKYTKTAAFFDIELLHETF